MSNIHLNWCEKSVLFDIFDCVRHSHGTDHDREELMERIEHQLNRYGDKDEPTATDAPEAG